MEDDRTLVYGIGGNFSDVANSSFLEPPEKGLQVQSSTNNEPPEKGLQVQSSTNNEPPEKERGNVSLRVMEILRQERSKLLRTLAAPDLEGRLSRMLLNRILKTLEAKNACPEIDRKLKGLGDQQSNLEIGRARHLEGPMSDLNMAKESVAAMFLKKEYSDLHEMLVSFPHFEGKFYLMDLILTLNFLEAGNPCPDGKMKAALLEAAKIWNEGEFSLAAKDFQKFENNRLEELKQLKYHASKLEKSIKKILSAYEDRIKKVEKGLNFSRITAAAIMKSCGIAGAVIIAFCLRHK